ECFASSRRFASASDFAWVSAEAWQSSLSLVDDRGWLAGEATGRRRFPAKCGDVECELIDAGLDSLETLDDLARGAVGGIRHRVELGPDRVDAVLHLLQPLRDRAKPARELLEIAGRGEVQGAHRRLLSLGHLLAGRECARQGGVENGVLEEVIRQLADRVLGLAGDAGAQTALLLTSFSR